MTTLSNKLNNPTLADILRSLLTAKKISASELARQIDIPQPTIQRLASGTHTKPHLKTLATLANFFGITQNQLRGIDPIPWLKSRTIKIQEVPLITLTDALKWPTILSDSIESIVIDIQASERTYAVKMPDNSMEPLIPKGSILIIDPDRTPQYRSFIAVKIKNSTEVFIRQLIIDTKNCYIKPLSQDFEQFKMAALEPDDSILGVVVEVRLHCEDRAY